MAFTTLSTLFSLGFFAGLNLYAVILVSGLAIRYHWLTLTPQLQSLQILATPKILIIAGVMYVVEFFADKIPWIDNVWDAIHTVIRPVAATFLALHVLGNQDPAMRIVAAMICGTLALTSHAAKAGTRLSTNLVSPVEPFTNIGLSLTEDAVAVGSVYVIYKHPYVAIAIVAFFIAIIVWFAPKLYRAVRSVFRRKNQAGTQPASQ